MRVTAELARSVRARWPHRADSWLTDVEAELNELCRRFSAVPHRVIPARFAFVIAASTPEHALIMRATTDPDAGAQTAVANELARLRVGPRIHEAITTDTGTWTVMDRVTPGTPLADADPRTFDIKTLTDPLLTMAEAPAPRQELPNIADWLRGRLLDDHLADLPPATSRASSTERTHALGALNDLTANYRAWLCHGDASPWNILADASGRWLFIDPRGVRGEVEYDAAVIALKISAAMPSAPDVAKLISNETKLDLEKIRAWETVARAARV